MLEGLPFWHRIRVGKKWDFVSLHQGCAAGVSINAWCVRISGTGVKVHPFQQCETWSFRAKRTLRQTKLDEAVTWRFI